MRVACISHGSIVGLNRRSYDLLHTRLGLDVTVVVPDRWIGDLPNPSLHYVAESGGARVMPLRGRRTGNTSFFWLVDLASSLRQLHPDVVLLDEEPWSVVAQQTLAARLPAPLICYTKQNIVKRLPPPFGWFRRMVYRRAAVMWAVGETSAEVVHATGYRGPLEVIPHGVEVSQFTPGCDESRRRELGLHGVVIGYAGRLVAEKGVPDLLNAASQMARDANGPDFTLLVVGDGPLDSVVQRAATAGALAGRLRHLPAVPHDAAPAIYRLMDLFVLPSRTTPSWREQFGRALIEAGATGLPIVASDSGEIPFVVRALGGGVPVREGSAGDLASALRDLVRDSDRRAALGRANLENARRRFSHEAIAERMRDSLERVPRAR